MNAGIRMSLHIRGKKTVVEHWQKAKREKKLSQRLCAEQTEGKKLTALFAAAVKVCMCFQKTPSG